MKLEDEGLDLKMTDIGGKSTRIWLNNAIISSIILNNFVAVNIEINPT